MRGIVSSEDRFANAPIKRVIAVPRFAATRSGALLAFRKTLRFASRRNEERAHVVERRSACYLLAKTRQGSPMVRWYFCTFSTYGFWLPNDERGSGSDYVGSRALLPYGLATKVTTRKSVAWKSCDPIVRKLAKEALKYEPVLLRDDQIQAVARGFSAASKRAGVPLHACTILPNHTHVVTGRPPYPIEQFVTLLKGGATSQLRKEGIHPFQDQPPANGRLPHMWGRGEWNVYIDDELTLLQKIGYTERNAARDGRSRQRWDFVTPYVPTRE